MTYREEGATKTEHAGSEAPVVSHAVVTNGTTTNGMKSGGTLPMRVGLADLGAQYQSMKDELNAAVLGVMESGKFILGPEVAAIEEEIATYSGAEHAVAVNSGTDALRLALLAYGVKEGDEVITTPFTFVATIEAITQVGAVPVFADIDPTTFNLDPESVARQITPRTRALMPVDLFGQMADRAAYLDLAAQHHLEVIWDSAQAIGCSWDGKRLGEFPGCATLSFFPTKNLGAFGDGGMILTNDAELRDRLRQFRFHGSGGGYFYSEIGYCSRLDAMQAAILRVKLKRLNDWNEARRHNADLYGKLLEGSCVTLPVTDPRAYHTYHQYTVRSQNRDGLKKFLAAAGIDSGIYYPLALHLQDAYRFLGYSDGQFPYAERAAHEVLSLPIHPDLTVAQVEYVAEKVHEFAG